MTSSKNQKVGFISLGCPKALVDSERILTQLKMDGYDIVPNYDEASVVVVNTCGFIDSAKQESLDTIGEAIEQNGRVIVTGCMGTGEEAEKIQSIHPQVLNVSGPAAYETVVSAVKEVLPIEKQHDPLIDLVPPQGIKLTPRHYAYLKISEGCNHRCSFCIIPSMRGDLVSRPIAEAAAPRFRSRPSQSDQLRFPLRLRVPHSDVVVHLPPGDRVEEVLLSKSSGAAPD